MKSKLLNTPINFPNTLPEGYHYIEDEPTYDPNIHLELEFPKESFPSTKFGLTKMEIS